MKRFCFLALCLFSSFVFAQPLKNIVVFGDSLSDNGNLYEYMKHQLPESPPYYQGRFSNGPIWAEQLLSSYAKGKESALMLNYAYGGAGVSQDPEDDEVLFTLNREIESYLLSHEGKAEEDSLFVIWIGANNYFAFPEDQQEAINYVNEAIKQGMEKLVNHGAKHVLVMSLPDLGQTPVARTMDTVEVFSQMSTAHNKQLEMNISALKAVYPDVQWLYVDVADIMKDVVEHADEYGFKNTIDSCYKADFLKYSNQATLKMAANLSKINQPLDCSGYLFFDLVHPTEKAHHIFAQRVRRLLDEAHIEMKLS